MKKIIYILVLCCGLAACQSRSTGGVSLSSVAQVTAMSFGAQEGYPGFAQTRFAVEERIDTGLIYNKDSIMYGTPLNRAIPKFSFAATPKQGWLQSGDTTYTVTGTDTLNMTGKPLILTIVSADGKNMKSYEIKLTIHQVDPDLFIWNQLSEEVCAEATKDQQVLLLNELFYYYTTTEDGLIAYLSEDGSEWNLLDVSGLPEKISASHMIADETVLYAADSTDIYLSEDGAEWTLLYSLPEEIKLHHLLFRLGEAVWFLAEKEEQIVLGHFDLEGLSQTYLPMPDDTPVSDLGTCVFASASERARAMIMGGVTREGLLSSRRTNLEYSPFVTNEGHVRVIDYSDQEVMDSLSGVAMTAYMDKLYRFGGTNMEGAYFASPVYESVDEGYHWTIPDSAHHVMPETITQRKGMSVVVKDNNIYLFGGYNEEGIHSDVYRGRKTSADWVE